MNIKDEFALFKECLKQRDIPQALKLISHIKFQYPNLPEIDYLMGICHFELGDWELAKQYLESELSKSPNDQRCLDILHEISTQLTPKPVQKIILGSAHKVGSTWLFRVMKDVFSYSGIYVGEVPTQINEDGVIMLDPAEPAIEFLRSYQKIALFKTHDFPPNLPAFYEEAKFLTVVRHPRDTIVSAAFYLSKLDAEKGGRKGNELYDSEDRKGQIRDLIIQGDWIGDRLISWYREKKSLCIRYEDMKTNFESEFKKVCEFLKIPFNPETFQAALDNQSIQKNKTKSIIHRKGESGDWKNYFDDELLDFYLNFNNGYWLKIEQEMGYSI